MGILNTLKNFISGKNNTQAESQHQKQSSRPSQPSEETYIAIIEAERAQKDAFFRRDPYNSPFNIEEREQFNGLNYYPPDLTFRYILPLHSLTPEAVPFKTSTDDERVYYRVAKIKFEVNDQPTELTLYQSEGQDDFFLPFKDSTSGSETYGGGRYLEPSLYNNNQVLVDFNLAYNPYCAYTANFSCPLPPPENWLNVPIKAGEKNYKEYPKVAL